MNLLTATAELDLSALANNVRAIKALAPQSKMLAVLKANAYGHGLVRIAKALAEQSQEHSRVDAFGVARIDEALVLREQGITTPIVLLEGFFSKQDLPLLVKHNLQTIVHNQHQLDAICQATDEELSSPIKVWLKIDTGMHRLGISPEQFDHYHQALKSCAKVEKELTFISHLSSADDVSSDKTNQQFALFERLTAQLDGQHECLRSLANSAGTLAWPQTHFDWIRPGIMMYGINPMADNNEPSTTLLPEAIAPVMTLKSSLIAIRDIKSGDSVGYSETWTAKQDTTIGVVAIGYGDGYPRHAKNGTPVLINGRIVPLVGRVSMDMITVDLGANASENLGDVATLWGKGLPIEQVAECATTIPYELLCNITRRVQTKVV